MTLPEWVLQYKQKNTEIKVLKNKYYLYKITSIWSKEKKRAEKKTLEFLGTITSEGLIAKKRTCKTQDIVATSISDNTTLDIDKLNHQITVKEYGATKAILSTFASIIEQQLKQIFSDD